MDSRTNRLWIGLAISVIILSITGCGGGGKTDITPPIITAVHAALPGGFDFNGGKIGLFASVTDNIGVARVFANVVKDGVASPIAWLAVTSGSEYGTTNYTIPGNPTANPQTYTIHVWAQDTGGNVTETNSASFNVPPAGGANPPTPPNI